jgi:hypothetical protein
MISSDLGGLTEVSQEGQSVRMTEVVMGQERVRRRLRRAVVIFLEDSGH